MCSQALDLKPNYVRAWANMGISYANQVKICILSMYLSLSSQIYEKESLLIVAVEMHVLTSVLFNAYSFFPV